MPGLIKNHDTWYSEYYSEDDVKLSLKVEVLHAEQTPFQKLVMMRNETFGTFMMLDGFIQVTQKDEFIYHDMICHVPMAVNPGIKRVLIIGGGDGGTAREVARYAAVEKIDMIEIDEAVVRACQKYIPQTSEVLSKDSRINLMFEDGLAFVRNAAAKSYDLIIVDSTDPEGPGESLFSEAFYRDCYRALGDDGILINLHESALFDGDKQYFKNAHKKIKEVFPIAKVYGFNLPTYGSGYWYFGFASKKYHPIDDHKAAEWEKLGIKTKYYNSELHKGCFALPNYVKEILESV
ncbi:MAG: polyamine aminopropyltransferase [Clostridiales bacterium]|nr:polyamine aminopropyltransferase [Clostridiales bacterium]